jgi:apolipoprotein N-acyltransferase
VTETGTREQPGRAPLRNALALTSGAAAVLAFSPFDLYPVGFLCLGLLFHLWLSAPGGRSAFVAGYLYGLGLFGAGVSWIYISLSRFGGMHPGLAVIATLGFCAILALFPAIAGLLQSRLRAPTAVRAAIVIPAAWTVTEWARGIFLTGFPWLGTGYAYIDTPLAGYAPVAGVHAMTLLAAVCTGLAVCILRKRARMVSLVALVLILGLGSALRAREWTFPSGQPPVRVDLLQGNIDQDMKFDPQRYAQTLQLYYSLAAKSGARLIVLPETAVPRMLDLVDPEYIAALEAVARRNGGDLLLGVPVRRAPGEYYNSVVSLGSAPNQIYSKAHLVPFGEFIPPGFGWVLNLLSIPLADFSRGGPEQRPMTVAGMRVALNVCYEDAFGAEIIRQLPEAELLVNVSNVAWFGDSLAPAQHLQISRMRALESGRMHLTAANSGITAAIDRTGKVLARLPQFVTGTLEVHAIAFAGATPYVRVGDRAVIGAALLMLLAAAAAGRLRAAGR